MNCLEIDGPVLFADGLEHLDGNDLVEMTAAIPVVFETYVDPIGKTCLFQPRTGEFRLLGGKRQACNATAGLADGKFRETAPATADFQHVIIRPDLQLLDDSGIFGFLRIGE